MATALRLYGLRHFEWLREPVHDSNCLLAWGPDVLVVAFRGTDSLANIKADIKVGCAWEASWEEKVQVLARAYARACACAWRAGWGLVRVRACV